MLLSNCVVCNSKKSKFLKQQETSRLLSSLGIKAPLSKIPIVFCFNSNKQGNTRYKMNEISNKFLLAGDKCMSEMHLRQPGFTYRACSPFAKNKERVQKFKEKVDWRYIYQNELDKTCFQRDMAYGVFKDLTRRTASDKILSDKAFNIAKNPKYEGYQRGLTPIVYKYFDKKNF